MTRIYTRLNDRVVLGFGASDGVFVPDFVEQETDKLLKILSNHPDCDGHRNEFRSFYGPNGSMGILCRPFIGNHYEKEFQIAYITGYSFTEFDENEIRILEEEKINNLNALFRGGNRKKYGPLLERLISDEKIEPISVLDYAIRIESPDSTASRMYIEEPIRRNSPKKWKKLSELHL